MYIRYRCMLMQFYPTVSKCWNTYKTFGNISSVEDGLLSIGVWGWYKDIIIQCSFLTALISVSSQALAYKEIPFSFYCKHTIDSILEDKIKRGTMPSALKINHSISPTACSSKKFHKAPTLAMIEHFWYRSLMPLLAVGSILQTHLQIWCCNTMNHLSFSISWHTKLISCLHTGPSWVAKNLVGVMPLEYSKLQL